MNWNWYTFERYKHWLLPILFVMVVLGGGIIIDVLFEFFN